MSAKLEEIAERLAEDIGWAQATSTLETIVILAALQQARDLGREEAQAEVERMRGLVTHCPECGAAGECPCIGNLRERTEKAEAEVARLREIDAFEKGRESVRWRQGGWGRR